MKEPVSYAERNPYPRANYKLNTILCHIGLTALVVVGLPMLHLSDGRFGQFLLISAILTVLALWQFIAMTRIVEIRPQGLKVVSMLGLSREIPWSSIKAVSSGGNQLGYRYCIELEKGSVGLHRWLDNADAIISTISNSTAIPPSSSPAAMAKQLPALVLSGPVSPTQNKLRLLLCVGYFMALLFAAQLIVPITVVAINKLIGNVTIALMPVYLFVGLVILLLTLPKFMEPLCYASKVTLDNSGLKAEGLRSLKLKRGDIGVTGLWKTIRGETILSIGGPASHMSVLYKGHHQEETLKLYELLQTGSIKQFQCAIPAASKFGLYLSLLIVSFAFLALLGIASQDPAMNKIAAGLIFTLLDLPIAALVVYGLTRVVTGITYDGNYLHIKRLFGEDRIPCRDLQEASLLSPALPGFMLLRGSRFSNFYIVYLERMKNCQEFISLLSQINR